MPPSKAKPTSNRSGTIFPENTMKSNPIRIAVVSLLPAASLALSSCATTGDPSTGGIFWSETKAQDRLAERQDHLENTENRTRFTNRSSVETQRRIDALR